MIVLVWALRWAALGAPGGGHPRVHASDQHAWEPEGGTGVPQRHYARAPARPAPGRARTLPGNEFGWLVLPSVNVRIAMGINAFGMLIHKSKNQGCGNYR